MKVCDGCGHINKAENAKCVKCDNDLNRKNDISIEIYFSGVICDKCKENFAYNIKCPNCGKVFENFEGVDPKYIEREKVFGYLKDNADKFNELVDKFRSVDYVKENQSYISNLIRITHKLNYLSETNVFRSIDLIDLENYRDEAIEFSKKVDSYMKELITLYKELNEVETPRCYININNRVKKIIEKFYRSINMLLESILSKDIYEFREKNKKAQIYLKEVEKELSLLSQVIASVKFSEENKIDESFLPLLIKSNNLSNSNGIDIIAEETYKYFSDFIIPSFKETDTAHLMNLSLIKSAVMNKFIEERFIKKAKLILKIFERAKEKNGDDLKVFIKEYFNVYKEAILKSKMVQDKDLFNSKKEMDEDMYVEFILTSYKTLIEGVFGNICTIILAANRISKRKEFDFDKLLNRDNYADKLNELSDNTKINLNILAEDKEFKKLIRNAVAHDSYSINKKENTVKLINKEFNKDAVKITEEERTYFEIIDSYLEIQENIFAIIFAFNIYLLNNKKIYNDEYEKLLFLYDDIVEDKENITFLLGLKDIKDINITSEFIDNKERIIIRGKNISNNINEDGLISLISTIIGSYKDKNDEDIICIEVNTNNSISKIGIENKFLNRYRACIGKSYNIYEYILIKYLSNIEVNGKIECRNDYGYQAICDIGSLIKEYSFKNNAIENDELYHILDVLKELKLGVIKDELVIYFYNSISSRKLNFKEFDKLLLNIKNTAGIKDRVDRLMNNKYSNIGRNDKCPCGSSKKYKKCCLGS